MQVKLKDVDDNIVHVLKMADGEIAQVISWKVANPVGKLVQRCGIQLVVLGEPHSSSYPSLFNESSRRLVEPECLVRLLKAGAILELND